MSYEQVSLISLEEIKVEKHNVRKHDIDVGKEDLAASIKAVGLLQPITAYLNSETKSYVILAGQRRLNAFHYLNKKYPGDGFDKIKCILIEEPKTPEAKLSLSLAENITQLQMHNTDLVKAVTDLYNMYHDYEVVQEKFGLTKYMVDKYVRLARLPDRLKTAINDGEISPNPKSAESAALRAVDVLQYTKGGDVDINQVLDLSKAYAQGEINSTALDAEAVKGGPVEEIKERAKKKPSTKQTIDLSSEVAEKLQSVAKEKGETEKDRATYYVVKGVTKDYRELDG